MTEHEIETNSHLRTLLKERDDRILELEKQVEELDNVVSDLLRKIKELENKTRDRERVVDSNRS